MEFSMPSNVLLLVLILILVPASSSELGSTDEYPHLGAAGVVANKDLPQAEAEGESGQFYPRPEAGTIGTNAPLLYNKALHCLTDKSIYHACGEAHRLSRSGELDVPPDYTDEYCNGPCLAETYHALDCIEGIFRGFIFLNTATLNNVRDTIEEGCGYGPDRGNFNVVEHIQKHGDEAGSHKNAAFYTLVLVILGLRLLF